MAAPALVSACTTVVPGASRSADPAGLAYSVTSPPVAEYDPAVGVEIQCAAYYPDGSLTSTGVRD